MVKCVRFEGFVAVGMSQVHISKYLMPHHQDQAVHVLYSVTLGEGILLL